jgi:hypothetical protein
MQVLGWVRNSGRGVHRLKISDARLYVETAKVASPAGFEPATCGLETFPRTQEGRGCLYCSIIIFDAP